ncbi:MAG: hypothetical protein JW720_07810 [Sedimentisphaerales bacterium]|nr:hypothetical protein [Sedimentisphaerales bacterium]
MSFDTIDWIVIASYFALIMGIAFWIMRQRQQSSTDYFLAGRHMPWFVIGASIFASNIDAQYISDLACRKTKTGILLLTSSER